MCSVIETFASILHLSGDRMMNLNVYMSQRRHYIGLVSVELENNNCLLSCDV